MDRHRNCFLAPQRNFICFLSETSLWCITVLMTQHGRNVISNYWYIDCLFNSLFSHQQWKYPISTLLVLCVGNPSMTGGFPSRKMSGNAQSFNMSWRNQRKYCLRIVHLVTVRCLCRRSHFCDVIMGAMASQITSLAIVYSSVYSGANQINHQSSTLLDICAQKTNNAWNVSIWWRHHEPTASQQHSTTLWNRC